MAQKFKDRLQHAFNAFVKQEENPFPVQQWNMGASYGSRPDRTRMAFSNERSIISSIYTRLGIDIASVSMRHVQLDESGRYIDDITSGLNNCLTLEANIDQAARHFRQNMATMLFDKGVIAVVPVETDGDPILGSYDIKTMRVGEITEWYPRQIRVKLYDDRKGLFSEIVVDKVNVAIIENPLYSVMNEPNSTLQRLIRKLNMLDAVDEASSSGKLDLIIQLPYVIKSDARRQQAEQRRNDIEVQLKGSKYGIAYTDGTEKITQLNRPTENNLLKQIEYLTDMLYGQLGLTADVFNGTASEAVMLNYHNRTIDPVLGAIAEGMKRVFLTKNARTRLQSVEYFRDPFKLVAITAIAELADKLTRNEVVSSNEMRSIIGLRPSKDPKAEQLLNKNLPVPPDGSVPVEGAPAADTSEQDSLMEETLAGLEADADKLIDEGEQLQ